MDDIRANTEETETPRPVGELEAEAYSNAIDLATFLLQDVFESARELPEAIGRDELLYYLRVELGLADHYGPHNPAPGLQSKIALMD